MNSLDLRSPDVLRDPFPYYREIRRAGRCVYNDLADTWMVTGYDDSIQVLRAVRTFSSALMSGDVFGPWYRGAATMLGADPPEHARLRSVVQQHFTTRAVARQESLIAEVAQQLLHDGDVAGRLRGGQPVDMIEAFAAKLPITVVGRMLGLPAADDEMLAAWTADMALGSVAAAYGGPDSVYQTALATGERLADYIEEQLRSRLPSEGVTGSLLAAGRSGQLAAAEVTAACVLLILAGTETVTRALGNAIELLGSHPEARRLVVKDPESVQTAVEEVLRYCGPAQFDPRLAVREATVGGTRVPAGAVVWVLEAAANRDPAHFDLPDDFDITRAQNRHLSFGSGPHLCVGAALARLELQVALSCLLALVPDYEVERTILADSMFVRGPQELWIRSA